MSTRQRSRPAVASAVRTEWPHMVSAVLLLAVTVPPPLFTSDSNTSLAAVDEFGRTRNLSHRRSGRTAPVLPCGMSRARMRSSGLQPGCSAILNKCWSSDPCQRSQFDNRIRSVRPADPAHASPSEARLLGHAPFRFKRGRSTPSSRHDRPRLGR